MWFTQKWWFTRSCATRTVVYPPPGFPVGFLIMCFFGHLSNDPPNQRRTLGRPLPTYRNLGIVLERWPTGDGELALPPFSHIHFAVPSGCARPLHAHWAGFRWDTGKLVFELLRAQHWRSLGHRFIGPSQEAYGRTITSATWRRCGDQLPLFFAGT